MGLVWLWRLQDKHLVVRKNAVILILLCVIALLVVSFGFFVSHKLWEEHTFYLKFPATILSDKVHTHTRTADDLANQVRILCFVTTTPGRQKMASAVNVTWLKRCTRHLFVSSVPLEFFRGDENLVLSDVPEGRDHLTAKTFSVLMYLYRHELNNFDWFIKADDDSYVIVENLRLLLSQYSPDDPVYLGHHFNTRRWTSGNVYMSGGATYALSRQALRTMGQKGLSENGGVCQPQEPDEDVEVGRCLYELGIQPHRTVDVYGRETFHPGHPYESLFQSSSSYSVHPKQTGPNCCSQLTITFHHVTPNTIYTLELLLYHIDVYGRHSDDVMLRQLLFKTEEEHLTGEKEEKDLLGVFQ